MLSRKLLFMAGAIGVLLHPIEAQSQLEKERPLAASIHLPEQQRFEVKGTLVLRVVEAQDVMNGIEAVLPELGGRLLDRRQETVLIEVEPSRFSEAMGRIASFGVELDRSVQVQDRTPEFVDTLARIRSMTETRNRIVALHEGVTGVKDPLRVERALVEWDEQVAKARRDLARLHQVTEKSQLLIELKPTFGVIKDPIPDFKLPFPWLEEVGLDRLLDLQHQSYPPSPGSIRLAVTLDGHLTTLRATEDSLLGPNRTAMSGGLRSRGVFGTAPIGWAAGMDLELGAGFGGGFLYEYRLLIGMGASIGKVLSFGIVSGVGFSGLTGGTIPFGLDVPVEAFGAMELGPLLHASTWTRSSWILASEARQNGSDTALFGDEFAAGLSLLVGKRKGEYSWDRTGFVLQGAYRELLGTHAHEIRIGYGVASVDLSGH